SLTLGAGGAEATTSCRLLRSSAVVVTRGAALPMQLEDVGVVGVVAVTDLCTPASAAAAIPAGEQRRGRPCVTAGDPRFARNWQPVLAEPRRVTAGTPIRKYAPELLKRWGVLRRGYVSMARPPRHRIELSADERAEVEQIARAEKRPWQEVQAPGSCC